METNRKDVSPEEAAEELNKRAKDYTEAEVVDAVNDEEKGKGLFEKVKVLQKYWDDVCTAYSLLKDYVSGEYRDCPWRVIAALAASLAYVISPLDLIPDLLPVIGFVDDAAVFGVALNLARVDLEKYKLWKAESK